LRTKWVPRDTGTGEAADKALRKKGGKMRSKSKKKKGSSRHGGIQTGEEGGSGKNSPFDHIKPKRQGGKKAAGFLPSWG